MNTPSSQQTPDPVDQQLAADVLDYLARRPEAMDTLEGIAEWWLLSHRVHRVVRRMERVLSRLTEDGVLEAVGDGTGRRYRLRPVERRSAD